MGFQRWHLILHVFEIVFFSLFFYQVLFPPYPSSLQRMVSMFVQGSVEIVWHRHTQDTRMGFTQWDDAMRSHWKHTTTTTTTGDGEERERHTDRGILLFGWLCGFFFVFFLSSSSSTASLSLPSPCWAWQLSAGSRSICLSLQLSDTQSTWFPMQ